MIATRGTSREKKDNRNVKGAENTKRRTNQTKRDKLPVKWWDAECEQVIKKRENNLKEFARKEDIKSFIEFNKARAIAIKIIQEKKRKDLQDFLLGINRNTNPKYMWNRLKLI